MTIYYKVDGIVIKHFKTALCLAVKTNAKLMTRSEERKNYSRGTVLFRNGSLLVNGLSKSRKQWAEKVAKQVDTSVHFYSQKYVRSKYQILKSRKRFVKKFNKSNRNIQQLRLEAEWHRLVYKVGYCDNINLTLNDVQKKMENIGCKFK